MTLDWSDAKPRQPVQICSQVKGRTDDGGYIRCGREFWGYTSHQRCPECSAQRQRENEADRRQRRLAKRTSERRAARLELRCAVCGGLVPIARDRSGNAYCSPACRQKGYRQRRSARLADLEREADRTRFIVGPRQNGSMGIQEMLVNAIVVGPEHRPAIESTVAAIARSVEAIGLLHPIAVRRMEGGRPYLTAGRQRLEALKRLRRETIPVIEFDDDDIKATLRRLDDNLCRAELSPAAEASAQYSARLSAITDHQL